MGIPNIPPCPNSLKPINNYLNIASEHDGRDAVVSYWCRLYATQQGLKIDKSSPEAKKLLFFLLDWLEKEKTHEKDNEAIAHEVAAQAYLENHALSLFNSADQQERAGNFSKNVVKQYFTAGILYSMLDMFGELTDEVAQNAKYAKWRATYIHTCLKNGEVPEVPVAGGTEDSEGATSGMGFTMPGASGPTQSSGGVGYPIGSDAVPSIPSGYPAAHYGDPEMPTASQYQPPPTPAASLPYNIPPTAEQSSTDVVAESGVPLNPELVAKAQKMCKYASSALNYDDVGTAVSNLRKALALLTTGEEE